MVYADKIITRWTTLKCIECVWKTRALQVEGQNIHVSFVI